VATASFHAPKSIEVISAFPDAPDQLTPGMISQARFGKGTFRGREGRRNQDGGWGGGGVGGAGIGRVRGGTCSRNPAGPSTIIDRREGFPK
jgi:hypothetical protein